MSRLHPYALLPSLALLAGLAAPAAAYEDMVSGFAIDPPAPFAVASATPKDGGVHVSITSTTGEPPVPGAQGALCEIAYDLAEANAALTQAQINEAMQSLWRREQVTASVAGQLSVDDLSYFTVSGASGIELVLTPKAGPDAANVRLVLGLAETPRARLVISCATTAAALPDALPQFRALRATIRLP